MSALYGSVFEFFFEIQKLTLKTVFLVYLRNIQFRFKLVSVTVVIPKAAFDILWLDIFYDFSFHCHLANEKWIARVPQILYRPIS